MDRKNAKQVVLGGIESITELGRIFPKIKENCDEDEYRSLQFTVCGIIADITDKLINPIYDQYPDLEAEIDG